MQLLLSIVMYYHYYYYYYYYHHHHHHHTLIHFVMFVNNYINGFLTNSPLHYHLKSLLSLLLLVVDKVLAHAIPVRRCVYSSPVTLAFEPVVEINPLSRDTGPL